MIRRLALQLMFVLCLLSRVEARETNSPAKIEVSGYGLFGNREIKRLLQVLEPGKKPIVLQPTLVEDGMVIVFSRLQRDGYLNAVVGTKITTTTGEVLEHRWTEPLEHLLPRPLEIKRVEIGLTPGRRFYYEDLVFSGLTALSLREATHFFMEVDGLLPLKTHRVFSPRRLQSSLHNLQESLERLGFENARIMATNLVIHTNTGAVQVRVEINEGLKSFVKSVRREIYPTGSNAVPRTNLFVTNAVFSRMWQQDLMVNLRRQQYARGYADARVQLEQAERVETNGAVEIGLVGRVYPGNQIRVGQVRFEGEQETHETMMRRKIKITAGDLLNPLKAEQGRYRLARLGAFEAVELSYTNVTETARDVIYTVREGKHLDLSLLAGYGSYEQLRGGFDLEQYNLWGLAHRSHLRAVQSFKASSANYLYTIPQVAGDDTDFFLHARGLIREEIDFTREEFGGGAGARRFFPAIDSEVSVRYDYQVLSAVDLDFSPEDGLLEADVGAFVIDIKHDKRDNPLVPRNGYKFFTTIETASEVLGGDVDYQRVELAGSYHLPVGAGRWLHFGLAHGFITTAHGASDDLPFNRRFFPGGENSIRGYQFGEASPRNENGNIVGAESYLLGNAEFEQSLTRSLSVVFFFDALGAARRLADYPGDETLYSVGGGLRWNTIIGPARLEYGYNLRRRQSDPAGTVHFSIGFPF